MTVGNLIKILSSLNQDSLVKVKVSNEMGGKYESLNTIRKGDPFNTYYLVSSNDKTFIDPDHRFGMDEYYPIVYGVEAIDEN